MTASLPKLLIIEDESELTNLLKLKLSQESFTVMTTKDGNSGIKMACEQQPDLIILDMGLPDISGNEVCKRLKGNDETKNIAIIFLTGRKDENEIVRALELGADDYITKPFQPRELVARIKAVLKRTSPKTEEKIIKHGLLTLDLSQFEVRVEDEVVALTLSEFKILWTLAGSPGQVFTRDQLLTKMAGDDVAVVDRTIDVHVGVIRKKLQKASEYIVTVRGIGYKCKPLSKKPE